MTSFQEMTFSELLSDAEVFVDGDWVESKDQDPNGDVRLIQLADIGDGFYIDKSSRFLNSETAKRLKCTYLKEGDILVARMPDPLGRACIFPQSEMPCVTVVDVCIIRPNQNKVDNRWLMHTINSPVMRQRINEYVTGTTRQRISRGNFSKLKVSVPSLAEQRRIAAILDQADVLRQKRQQAIEKLDQLLQATFIDMFGDLTTDKIKFANVALPVKNSFTNGPFGSDLLSSELVSEGVPVIYIRDIRESVYKRVSESYVTMEKAQAISNCHVASGDILIAKVGDPPGTTAIYPLGEPDAVVTQDVIRIKPNIEVINSVYLWGLLNSDIGKHIMKPIIVEATRSRFSLRDLKALELPLPPLDLQEKWSKIALSIEDQKQKLYKQLNMQNQLFSSLQNQAFNGTL